jgi:hypothetical protein
MKALEIKAVRITKFKLCDELFLDEMEYCLDYFQKGYTESVLTV